MGVIMTAMTGPILFISYFSTTTNGLQQNATVDPHETDRVCPIHLKKNLPSQRAKLVAMVSNVFSEVMVRLRIGMHRYADCKKDVL